MKTLQISNSDILPIEFLSLRNVVYGGSGAGKTAFGRVIFEESIKSGIPCGVIDLKADWWGLKSSADGKCEASILRFLVDNHPETFTSEQVGEAAGYSHNSGGFNNSLGRLRTLELITRGQPMKATDEFFQ